MSGKTILIEANQALSAAIKHALPQIQKQAGESVMTLLKYRHPEGEFQVKLEARARTQWFTKNKIIELRITGVEGYLKKDGLDVHGTGVETDPSPALSGGALGTT